MNISILFVSCSGSEDEQFEEEKEMIMKEIERVSRFINRERPS